MSYLHKVIVININHYSNFKSIINKMLTSFDYHVSKNSIFQDVEKHALFTFSLSH